MDEVHVQQENSCNAANDARSECGEDNAQGRIEQEDNGSAKEPTPGQDEKEEAPIQSLIREGLANLNRTADGNSCAYLDLTISGTAMESADALEKYVHIQNLRLTCNKLRDIQRVGVMKHLALLDASNNHLSEVLDVVPPTTNLRTANLSNNCITRIRDLSGFSRLTSLVLDNNGIRRITGVSGLTFLTKLSLKGNSLVSCAGLEGLPRLRALHIDNNRIRSLVPLSTVTYLETLTASSNFLRNIAGVQVLERLQHLDVSSNNIPTLEELRYAQSATFLDTLCISGNPCEQAHHFRLHTIYLLPQVTELDHERIDAKEKVHAANLHGADAAALRTIRKQHFPDGELDDGGGAIPPTSAGMVASDGCDGADSLSRFAQIDELVSSPLPEEDLITDVAALGNKLSALCSNELEICRAAWKWVVSRVQPPAPTWQVGCPVFLPQYGHLASRLLKDSTGMWPETVSWLFTEILRSCEIVAVSVSGYWKDDEMWPGTRTATHNHCWSAAKINGKWRLFDLTWAAQRRARLPFYVPPEFFSYHHFPLEAHWQLLSEPIDLESFWRMPNCSVLFLHKGLQLVNPVPDVLTLEHGREGGPMPTCVVGVEVPEQLGIRHKLMDDALRTVSGEDSESLVFEKVSDEPPSAASSRVYELWTAFPSHGAFFVEVEVLEHCKMPVQVDGIPNPVVLNIQDAQLGLRAKVVVPPPTPHDPSQPSSAEPFTPIAFNTQGWPTVASVGCKLYQLIDYQPPSQDEAAQ